MTLAEMTLCCKQKARRFVPPGISTRAAAAVGRLPMRAMDCLPTDVVPFSSYFAIILFKNKIWKNSYSRIVWKLLAVL